MGTLKGKPGQLEGLKVARTDGSLRKTMTRGVSETDEPPVAKSIFDAFDIGDDPDPVEEEVLRIRYELRQQGISVPDDLSELEADEKDEIRRRTLGLPGISGRAKRQFIKRILSSCRVPADVAAVSRATTVRDAGVRDAHWAMVGMMGTLFEFARELNPYLDLGGRLTPEDMPYGKWLRLESVAALIRGTGDERILSLERDVAALRSASAVPASAGSATDETLAALEAEVAAMVESGKAPEPYSGRADRKEKPHEFLKRVYGRYLEKGREAIYLFQLRKIDVKLAQALDTYCWKSGCAVEDFIPTRKVFSDRTFAALEGGDGAQKVTRAVNAVSRRRQLAAKKANG